MSDRIESTSGDGAGPAEVVLIGGGLCGLLTGMLLADDGHRVTVLERDPEPPPAPTEAWTDWDRASVRQFHMGHLFLPRFRLELDQHLPRVLSAIRSCGALQMNPLETMPESMSGGWRDGDEQFEIVTGRRPVIEAVVAAEAAETPGLTVRRGVTVAGLLVWQVDAGRPPHVRGIETADGERIDADLVVDTSGRNSALPRLLGAIGATQPDEESDDSGFVYYGRAYRSADGSVPPALGGGLQSYGSISTLTLAADNGTWQLALVASGKDRTMRRVRDERLFNELWGSFPLVAHWLDGEPISDLETMANLEDRIRHFVVDGAPVATGVAAVGDSWACTNPSVGRGASMALLHAVALRDHLRQHPVGGDPVAWSLAWDQRTSEAVEPFYRETVRGDRHRLGQIEAAIDQRPYETDDPFWHLSEAMPGAAAQDPEAMRAFLASFMMLRLTADVMADDELRERILRLGADVEPAPGIDRAELEALLA